MPVIVRRVRPEEWPALRELRLRGLRDAPSAFGSTYEGEAAFPDDAWRARAEGLEGVRATFVAEDAGTWLGIATGLDDDPEPGTAMLVGMFVAPEARGRGVATALLDTVVEWARSHGARRLELDVTEINDAAISLYERAGFTDTGIRTPLDHTPSLMEWRMARDL
ncbi:MAG: GNAT family N-acetyltransferase [Dehalococcoidia bacterium]